jgi:hypothetical protein
VFAPPLSSEWLLDLVAPPPESNGSVATVNIPPSTPGSMMLRIGKGGSDLPSRVRAYLAACPPAISGEGGHNQTFTIANAIVHGFALSEGDAWPYLVEWNSTCRPPWNEKELRHKLEEAISKGTPPPGKERGYLLAGKSIPPVMSTAIPKPARLLPLDPWTPFPVDVFPEPLQSLITKFAMGSYLSMHPRES